jgi:hypothetical protein
VCLNLYVFTQEKEIKRILKQEYKIMYPDKSVDQAPACFTMIRLPKVGSRFRFRLHQLTTVGKRCRWKFPLRVLLFASSPNKIYLLETFQNYVNFHPHPLALTKFGQPMGVIAPASTSCSVKKWYKSRSDWPIRLVNLNYFVVCIILRRNASLAWVTPQQSRISFWI